MRGSGTYYRIIDASASSFDLTNMSVLVPMMLKKGDQITEVTLQDFEKKLGYDLGYNPLYLGLKKILQTITAATVFRMNKNPMLGNLAVSKKGFGLSLSAMSSQDAFMAATKLKSVTQSVTVYPANIPVGTDLVAGSVKVYDNANVLIGHEVSGSIVADGGSGIAGTVDSATGIVTLSAGPAPTVSLKVTGEMDVSFLVMMKTAGNWDSLAAAMEIHAVAEEFVTAASVATGVPVKADSLKIYDSSGLLIAHSVSGTLVADNASGVAGAVNESTGVVTFSTQPTSSTIEIKYIPEDSLLRTYDLKVYSTLGSTNSLLETINFSFVPESDVYLDKIQSDYVSLFGESAITVDSFGLGTPLALTGATDGTFPSASDLDLAPLVPKNGFYIVMNGVVDYGILGLFQQFAEDNDRFVIADAPKFATYQEAKTWRLGVRASRNCVLQHITDQATVDGSKISVYPSSKVVEAFAKMFRDTGYLNYPFAGPLYGIVSMESMLETDFSRYAAELKALAMNYVKMTDRGPMLWEQRTLNPIESDLSYAHAVIILIHLAQRLIRFGDNFNFKLISPADLTVFQTGVEEILEDYRSRGFLWEASVQVPTWSEVLENGIRETDIPVFVKVAEDSEERTFLITVNK